GGWRRAFPCGLVEEESGSQGREPLRRSRQGPNHPSCLTGRAMAANAAPPVSDNPARPEGAPLVPPEEQFWKRYSAHGELPLSGASSFAIHVLVAGFLILGGFFLRALFTKPGG